MAGSVCSEHRQTGYKMDWKCPKRSSIRIVVHTCEKTEITTEFAMKSIDCDDVDDDDYQLQISRIKSRLHSHSAASTPFMSYAATNDELYSQPSYV